MDNVLNRIEAILDEPDEQQAQQQAQQQPTFDAERQQYENALLQQQAVIERQRAEAQRPLYQPSGIDYNSINQKIDAYLNRKANPVHDEPSGNGKILIGAVVVGVIAIGALSLPSKKNNDFVF